MQYRSLTTRYDKQGAVARARWVLAFTILWLQGSLCMHAQVPGQLWIDQ
jgi:hypothetical protein